MTLRLIERLKMAKTIDEIVICTSTHPDDAILVDLAQQWGVKALIGSEDDVLSRLILAANLYKADAVIRVTGDNVLTDPKTIDQMVVHHINKNADYTRTNGLPLGVTAEIMSATMLPRLHQIMPDPNLSEYMMLYAFDPEHFHCEVFDAPAEVSRPHYSLTVDTPADLELIRHLYAELSTSDGGPTIRDVVALLDKNPNLLHAISSESPIRMPGGTTITFGELITLLSERAERAHNSRQWVNKLL
jgi:spore coat polysaccharide biosynthesis protein SpsF